ncbi:MAG TPA: NUDIX domain-containing protein [Chitinophagaceae bacterium]
MIRLLRQTLFSIYKHLPIFLRWKISYALSSKFLVGMIFFIERDGRLLLVRHSYQKSWSLPGGWLKNGETIEEGARREIKEEFGASVTDIEILKTVAVKSKPVVDIAVACQFVEAPKSDKLEIEAFEFFSFDSMPSDIIRSHQAYIDEYGSRRMKV